MKSRDASVEREKLDGGELSLPSSLFSLFLLLFFLPWRFFGKLSTRRPVARDAGWRSRRDVRFFPSPSSLTARNNRCPVTISRLSSQFIRRGRESLRRGKQFPSGDRRNRRALIGGKSRELRKRTSFSAPLFSSFSRADVSRDTVSHTSFRESCLCLPRKIPSQIASARFAHSGRREVD